MLVFGIGMKTDHFQSSGHCQELLENHYFYITLPSGSSPHSLSHVWFFATPWIAAGQASLSIPNSQSLLKFMSIDSVMPSNHFIICPNLLFPPSIFPSIRVFSNVSALCIRSQNIGALALVLSMNIQDWFPLGYTGLIFLPSKGFSRFFSSTTIWKHKFFRLSLLYGPTLTSIHNYRKNHSFDYMDLCWQVTSLLLIC